MASTMVTTPSDLHPKSAHNIFPAISRHGSKSESKGFESVESDDDGWEVVVRSKKGNRAIAGTTVYMQIGGGLMNHVVINPANSTIIEPAIVSPVDKPFIQPSDSQLEAMSDTELTEALKHIDLTIRPDKMPVLNKTHMKTQPVNHQNPPFVV